MHDLVDHTVDYTMHVPKAEFFCFVTFLRYILSLAGLHISFFIITGTYRSKSAVDINREGSGTWAHKSNWPDPGAYTELMGESN